MLAGTTGTHGSARGRMTLLSAVIGLVVGFLLSGAADLDSLLGALFCFVGAVIGCLVISDLISGASRREGGGGALGFLVGVAALFVVAISFLVPVVALLVVVAIVWLGVSRHRRAQKKHAGLRVLR
jgi:chromate transport protein ChrA